MDYFEIEIIKKTTIKANSSETLAKFIKEANQKLNNESMTVTNTQVFITITDEENNPIGEKFEITINFDSINF
jgi:hypothetical protein